MEAFRGRTAPATPHSLPGRADEEEGTTGHPWREVCGVTLACLFITRAAFAGPPPATVHPLPATGQTETYPAGRADGRPGPVSVLDDGSVRAGAALRYRDNGDGTVTDLNTGLCWEKKCAGCGGLHDARDRYRWSADGKARTVWDWLAQINAEDGRGFAGHSDWRVPNVTELVSIIDYGKLLPSVSREFAGDLCTGGCSDPSRAGCSCTALGEYWSSTTFADFPAHALAVYFGMGLASDRVKTGLCYVRAVRGGLP